MHTQKIIKYNIKHLLIAALLLTAFILWSPHASASIVVEGDREFTDEVNNCLTTYRNAPGVVGDAIRELEDSENEHKIINSPDWSNTSNDLDKATGGSGSGTVTRVDSEKLKEYTQQIEALKNKDFCTALLHELWHALDADRGTRTSHSDKVDGAKRNEVEATLFQNLVHAIRGVPPRTTYGGVDISKHVVIGDEPTEQDNSQEQQQQAQTPLSVNSSFAHVKPGEYSEIYITITTAPGATINATASGSGLMGNPNQTATADDTGKIKLTWKINAYGRYTIKGTVNETPFNSSVIVN